MIEGEYYLETYRIENLTFTYPNRQNPALRDINLTIEQGEFVTLCGPSGCGKTTLLRQLKPSTTPHGAKSGTISFNGTPLDELPAQDAASKIGFVLQSPENQIVTDKVWHELAFGLESLGFKTPEIRLRVAEMASFFGIQEWFHKPVTELSGGQKQILALASIMAMQPSVLILDEPTSQLDPIAASEFLATIGKINRELGVTVILTEHRLEEALPLSSRAIVMDNGCIIADDQPHRVGLALREQNHSMFSAMPVPMRIWAAVSDKHSTDNIPVTVRDGAKWLNSIYIAHRNRGRTQGSPLQSQIAELAPDLPRSHFGLDPQSPLFTSKIAIELNDVWFRYEKSSPNILKGLSFKTHYGEISAILGGNGTGKTTMLSLISRLHSPHRGNIHTDTTVYALPQNPQSLFVAKTVREDLLEVLSERKLSKDEQLTKLASIVKLCRLEGLLDNHPYDLSGGEQQRAALAKVLLLQPKILLLDEPTKGLDAEYKQIFAAILRKLTDAGAAVVIVSHDVEFCAEYADRCALFFDGAIVTENPPHEFFCGNSFYTTSANRMARSVFPDAITAVDVIDALGGELPPAPKILDFDTKYEVSHNELPLPPIPPELSGIRKFAVLASALWLLGTASLAILNMDNFAKFIGGGQQAIAIVSEGAFLYVGIMLAFAVGVIGACLALSWKRSELSSIPHILLQKQPLPKRTIVASAMILLTIPLTIFAGFYLFDDRRFAFISMLILLQAMLPFALMFESRKPQARELVVIAVLCALAVAGRAAFFMLPQFKPVIAIIIIAGVAFGAESGFLVGAMTGLVSNMLFGQGPWTPWQMFAFGLIGFFAGILFRRGLLNRTPLPLSVFGGLATFLIYGGIMNPAHVLMFQQNPTREMFILSYLHGIPFDLVHAAATITFLAIISRPILEKLDRIKEKYGLVK